MVASEGSCLPLPAPLPAPLLPLPLLPPLLQRPQRRAMAAAGRREAGIAARRAANIIARTCKLPGEKERTLWQLLLSSILWESIYVYITTSHAE